jgi:hypothetical protein
MATHEAHSSSGSPSAARGARLARAARTHEEQPVAQPAQADGVAQRLYHRVLGDDLAKGLRPPPAIQGLMGRLIERRGGRG